MVRLRVGRISSFGLAFVTMLLAVPALALTLAEEMKLGKKVMTEVRPLELTSEPSLDEVGRRLTSVVQRRELPWRFWIVERMKGVNAFAAPGGLVFITRSYYEKLNDDEAAFVLGHEMAHIELRHYQKQLSRQRHANVGSLLLGVLTGNRGLWGTAADIGATAYVTHYSRVLEREADFAGYRYAQQAGYDAAAAVSALSKLGKEPRLHPWIANIYATHPILSVREDRLAALGGKEPEEVIPAPPAASHQRNLTAGLQPFDPPAPIAVRILGEDGKRWENRRRKSFTSKLHHRLTPLGFRIAGDDLMFKLDIGDPVAAARSRNARYLLLVTVHELRSESTGPEQLAGTPVLGKISVTGRLTEVSSGSQIGTDVRFSRESAGLDLLPADPDVLYTDNVVGRLADQAAATIALEGAKAAGARPAPPEKSPEQK